MDLKTEIIKTTPTVVKTMSSTQLSEMLGQRKTDIHKDIRRIFKDKIDKGIIPSSTDSRGYVTDYHLPELESKMFVAKKDINYLEKITRFWIDENSKVLSPAEQLLENAKRLVAHEKELEQLNVRTKALERDQFETKVQVAALVEGEGYYTIVGYCNQRNKRVDSKAAAQLGKRASEICKSQNIHIGCASHPLYGKVNTYPQEVLEGIIN